MRDLKTVFSLLILLVSLVVNGINGENPYRFYTWKITYGDIYPLGVKQQVLGKLHFLYILIYKYLHCSYFLLAYFDKMVSGNIDKWAVSRASDRLCDQ